ncbi:hypothetical protein [Aliidongia dinghuensis]|uniref:hypothetical protein n=1 Tax=Aliidongia dinghuensis TaxID=1867774 RepID=UPI00166DD8C8|nr:hypothetical protein [Aliidongia dinghuensis]
MGSTWPEGRARGNLRGHEIYLLAGHCLSPRSLFPPDFETQAGLIRLKSPMQARHNDMPIRHIRSPVLLHRKISKFLENP